MKFLKCWWSLACFQSRGQLTITVLCFRPPSPPTWIRWEVPSLRLEDMTTWEKPLTFSVSINLRNDCRDTRKEGNCNLWVLILFMWAIQRDQQEMDLVCPLSLGVVVEEGSHDWSADDGQTFSCFQLIGQRQQTRLHYVLLSIHAHQNQDLRPENARTETRFSHCFHAMNVTSETLKLRLTSSSWCVAAPPPTSWERIVQRWERYRVFHHPILSQLCHTE